VTIIPDTKDWTWVLQRPCPACDFDSRSFPREQIPSMLRDTAGQWRELLAGTGDLRRRPRPDVDERYGEQDPEVVSGELVDAAHRLADGFAAVTGEQWQRPGRRSDGATFTVESFGRYFIHDPIHHLHDVTGSPSI
jgi:hypothetical protein